MAFDQKALCVYIVEIQQLDEGIVQILMTVVAIMMMMMIEFNSYNGMVITTKCHDPCSITNMITK